MIRRYFKLNTQINIEEFMALLGLKKLSLMYSKVNLDPMKASTQPKMTNPAKSHTKLVTLDDKNDKDDRSTRLTALEAIKPRSIALANLTIPIWFLKGGPLRCLPHGKLLGSNHCCRKDFLSLQLPRTLKEGLELTP